MFAAVGMNGTRLMAFGLGETEGDAEADALVRMAEADVELVGDETPPLALLPLTTPDQVKAVAADLTKFDRRRARAAMI